jgi:hypothetical protein
MQSLGCTAEVGADDEELGEVQLAYNQTQCATAAPTASLNNLFNFSMPGGYGTSCNAVDVNVYSWSALYTTVKWNASKPDNSEDCTRSYIRVIHYNEALDGGWIIAGDEVRYGRWLGFLCSIDEIELDNIQMERGHPNRLATTARRYDHRTGTYTMRPFTMWTTMQPK